MIEDKKLIMVIDDIPENLQLLQNMLHDCGYRVVLFPGGRLALASATRNPPDLILLDINMPEMNGFEVCERLKADEKLKEIPVIFISAINETADKVRALSNGGVDYITKPFQLEEVMARVNTHLSLRDAGQKLKKQNEVLYENLRLREVIEQISRHDLKGPMTALLNVPEMLMNDQNLEPDQVELLQLLSKSAYRLMEMIQSSLDLYKMEEGTYQLTPVSVDVLKTVREVFREFNGVMKSKKLSSVIWLDQRLATDQDIFELSGEELLFFSLFSNLIKNAIEASPEGMEIIVIFSSTPQPTIIIKNQGVIPEPIRDRFFEPYFTSGKERGTGIGTFSARLMAKTLGGDLSFTTNESEGTALTLSLPSKLKEQTHENTYCRG